MFTFYKHSIGDNVQTILDWYQNQGVVEVIDWKLPMEVAHYPPKKVQWVCFSQCIIEREEEHNTPRIILWIAIYILSDYFIALN